jgi:hypothetical protein
LPTFAPLALLGKIASSFSANLVSRPAWKSSPRKTEPIIDEIDALLAACYGITAEELDFTPNSPRTTLWKNH